MRGLTAAIGAGLLVLGLLTPVSANDKVTICHAAGLDGTTKFVTLTIGWQAVYGPAGHFFENGTPRAGHEQDYLGPCRTSSPTPTPVEPTPTPTVEPTATPTATPEPTPTPEPSATPAASPTPEPSATPTEAPPRETLTPRTAKPELPSTDTAPVADANMPNPLIWLGIFLILVALVGYALQQRFGKR